MFGRCRERLVLAILLPFINTVVYAVPQVKCIDNKLAQISNIHLGDTKNIILDKLGEPNSALIDPDVDTSGQNSGEYLYYEGLDLFVADIGGVTYLRTTQQEHKSIYGIQVGMLFKEVSNLLSANINNKNKITVYLCDQPNFLDPHFTFNFGVNEEAKLVSIEILQSEF